MMDRNSNAITPIKDSNLQLSLPPSSQSQKSTSIKLAIRKDERLEHLDIPKGLIELLES